jgi:hypothetical protein
MTTDVSARGARIARIWIRIAALYLLLGAGFGVVMGLTHSLQYIPVHAHINLLGWATLALAGVIYHLFPQAGGSRLGIAHFWLHNLSLPPLMLALFLMFGGNSGLEPVVGVLSIVMTLGLALFAVNLFLNMGKAA